MKEVKIKSKENFLFENKFDKNIWLVFLSSKFATYQYLSLRDSTIASAVSKIQALTLPIDIKGILKRKIIHPTQYP